MSSTQMAREVIARLVSTGLRHIVIAPGSRSAPLAYAAADAEAAGLVRVHVRVDERTAGFYALGLLKAHALNGEHRAVAVVTTSGTAVANLHPAVLEASHTGLPLVVLSADRPHEWRGTGASQTTHQPHLYGVATRWSADLPARMNPAAVQGQVTRAVAAALGTITRDPGPVQLNIGFAEPLVPADRWEGIGRLIPTEVIAPEPGASAATLPPGARTLVIAGDGACGSAAELALLAQWPLLAEPSSGARVEGAIVHYQRLVADGLADDARRLIVFGHPTLSRTMSALLARGDREVIVVSPTARWNDVTGHATAIVPAVTPPPARVADIAWLERWREADAAVARTYVPSPIEQVALAVWEAPGVLLLGSSNTVRAFDTVVPGRDRGVRVLANRGLAGIDGLISTAHGLAIGLGAPVRVVLGDLSFAHDVGGLGRGTLEAEPDLDVIVVNDHGGGIFGGLEHGRAPRPLFERFFAAGQVLDPVTLARGFGADGVTVEAAGLADVLASYQGGRRVVEVPLPPV